MLELLKKTLDARTSNFARNLERVAENSKDEEALHDVRVAARRLIASLDTLRSVNVKLPRLKKTRRCIKEFLDALSPHRDAEVQLLQVEALLPQARNRQIRSAVLAYKKALQEQLKGWAMPRFKGDKVMQRLRSYNGALASVDETVSEAFVAATSDAWRRVEKCLKKLDTDDPDSLHRLRVAFKKFRYQAEVLVPYAVSSRNAELLRRLHLQRGTVARRLEAMHEVQDTLGVIHDLDVFLAGVQQVAPAQAESLKSWLGPWREEEVAAARVALRRAKSFWTCN